MTTFKQITDDARVLLNDVALDDATLLRYGQDQLLLYTRQALIEARRIRPDLFLSFISGDFPAFEATDDVPIPEQYTVPLVDYVVARAEMRDDEFASDGRASSLFQKFKAGMMGV